MSIYILEDRVVYDGAAIQDLSDLNRFMQARSVDAPDAAEPPMHVLVVDTDVADAADLVKAAGKNVLVVAYDASETNLTKLAQTISDKLGGRKADTIAFAAHGAGGALFLVDGAATTEQSVGSQAEFWAAVGGQLRADGRIDLLGCDVGDGKAGAQMLHTLEMLSGHKVAASTDLTGNTQAGGDWYLEVGDIDARAVYFDGRDLSAFKGTLANSAPVLTPPAQTEYHQPEGSAGRSLIFSAATGNAFTLTDPDTTGAEGAPAPDYTLRLSVDRGTMELLNTSGLTMVAGANGSGDVTFKGSKAAVQAALDAGIRFVDNQTDAEYNGRLNLTVYVNDNNDGYDSASPDGYQVAKSDMERIAVIFDPVNDAPTQTAPTRVTAVEDTDYLFRDVFAMDDAVDIAYMTDKDPRMSVTLSADHGTVTLLSLSGLTVTAGANGTGSVTVEGKKSDLNVALAAFTYRSDANWNGTDRLQVTTNDLGNGGPGALTAANTVDVVVEARNDKPLATIPALTQTMNEDGSMVFSAARNNAISFSDPDDLSGTGDIMLEVTLGVEHGTLTLSTLAGLTFVSGGSGTAGFTLRGTAANINAALAGMTYTATPGYHGYDLIDYVVNDLGNYGGAALSDSGQVAINVRATNDAPILSASRTTAATKEDTDLVFSANNLTFTMADPDDNDNGVTGDEIVTVRLRTEHGGISFSSLPSGVTFSDGYAGTHFVELTGKIADLTTAINNVVYRGDANYTGADTLTVTVDDRGNTGAGGVLTASTEIAITVGAVNDAPVNTIPADQTVLMNRDLVFSPVDGNALGVNDVDDAAGSEQMEVTFSVDHGTLTFASQTGLTFLNGTANGGATLTVSGTRAAIASALQAGLTYRGDFNYSGSDALTIASNDKGNAGDDSGTLAAGSTRQADGSITTVSTVAIEVTPTNIAPVNTVPGAQAIDEDTILTFGGALRISVADADDVKEGTADDEIMEVILSVNHGVLTLNAPPPGLITDGTNGASGLLVLRGTRGAINAALDGMTYTADLNYAGDDKLTITTNDLGNTGLGGELTDQDEVLITIRPVNDAPTFTQIVHDQSPLEGSPYVFAGSRAIQIGDVDDVDNGTIGDIEVQVTLYVTNGALTLGSTNGLTSFSGAGDSATTPLVIRGSLSTVNAALRTLTYTGDPHFNGTDTLNVKAEDLGNSGSGVNEIINDQVILNVRAANEAPVAQVPASAAVNEDADLVLPGLSVSDPDDADNGITGDEPVTVSVSAENGTLTIRAAELANVTLTTTNGSGRLVFSGTLADVNAALAQITYRGALNWNGNDNITLDVKDQGNFGEGTELADSETFVVRVNPVDDVPVNTLPTGTFAVDSGRSLSFAGRPIVVADVDDADDGTEGNLPVTVELTPGHGRITFTGAVPSGITVSTDAAGKVTLTGPIAGVNTLMETMVYTPSTGFSGAETIVVKTTENGASDTDTLDLTVNPVNTAPTNTVPGDQTMNEEGVLTFNGNIVINDPEDQYSGGVDDQEMDVTLSIAGGKLLLSGVTGLTFVNGTNDSGYMVLRGQRGAINAALNGMTFTADPDFAGDTTLNITSNDRGSGIAGAPSLVASSIVDITVNPINDAPTSTVPTNVVMDEDAQDVALSDFGTLSVADPDANATGTTPARVTLRVAHGDLNMDATVLAGLSTAQKTTLADGSVQYVLEGALATLNDALATLTYTPAANWNGDDALVIDLNDLGNVGAAGTDALPAGSVRNADGSITTSQTVTLTVTAVNDAPTNTAPDTASGPLHVNEDTDLAFTGARQLSVDDVDDRTDATPTTADEVMQVRLIVNRGNLTLTGAAGLTISGNNSSAVSLTGTRQAINDALATLVYRGDANYVGTDSLLFITNDQGRTGTGGALSATTVIDLVVDAVNDAPTLTTPTSSATAPLSVQEGQSLTFDGLRTITALDVDDQISGTATDNEQMQLLLRVDHGTLNLSGTSGLTFVAGANGSATMTIRGARSAINAALLGMTYSGDALYNGTDTLHLELNDLGNAGRDPTTDAATSDPLLATTDIHLVIAGINDAPTITPATAPAGGYAVDEDATLTLTNPFVVADPDDSTGDSAQMKVTLSISNATLRLGDLTGITFANGSANDSGYMVFTGTVNAVNRAMASLGVTPSADFNGTTRVEIVVDDQGNFGTGGARVSSDGLDIRVDPVNDAPVNTVPANQTIDESETLVFRDTNGNAISIADVDELSSTTQGNEPMRVTLTVDRGTLTLSTLTGLTVEAGANGTGTVTVSGTRANLNAALAGLSYTMGDGQSGTARLTMVTNDLGNYGGSEMTDTDAFDIVVRSVNNAPTATAPASAAMDEDGSFTFDGGNTLSVGDPDDADDNITGNEQVEVTLSTDQGTMHLAGLVGTAQFQTGTANDTGYIVLRGTLADINATLAGLVYSPNANYAGSDRLYLTVNDLGQFGTDPIDGSDTSRQLQTTRFVDLTVREMNDAPVVTAPTTVQVVREDEAFTFSDIVLTDVDEAVHAGINSGDEPMTVTLSVASGRLTFGSTTGLTFTAGANGDGTFTVTGTRGALNTALTGLVYQGNLNFSGTDALTLTVDDAGSYGTGTHDPVVATVNLRVDAVNDAPVNTLPTGAITTNEGGSGVDITGVILSDVDGDGTQQMSVTLSVGYGTLTLASLTGVTQTGNGTDRITVTGTRDAINAAINGLHYTPTYSATDHFYGTDVLRIQTDDRGNAGINPNGDADGTPLTTISTLDITVTPANDVPTLDVPAAQTVAEELALTFSDANGNAITLNDAFDGAYFAGGADAEPMQLTLSVEHGILNLGAVTGLTFAAGANGTRTMTIQGTRGDINRALAGMTYRGDTDYVGADTLTLRGDDRGNSGGTAQNTGDQTIAITVTPVNDAPSIVTAPANVTLTEDVQGAVSGITLGDVDAGSGVMSVLVYVGRGTLTLAPGGATLSGDNTASLTLTGTLDQLNAALASLRYTGNQDFNGTDSLNVIVNDQGNTGSGGPLNASRTITLTVDAVNDAPTNTAPTATQTVRENTSLVFSDGLGNGIQISDLDERNAGVGAGNEPMTVTLTVGEGTLAIVNSANGLTVTGGGTSTLTLTGTRAQINAALEGLTYTGNPDYNGADTLHMVTSDGGNYGTGGTLTAETDIAIEVTGVNSDPYFTQSPAAVTLAEEGNMNVLSGNLLQIADYDDDAGAAGTLVMQITFTVGHGTLSFPGATGVTVSGGANGTDTLTLEGSITDINNALASLQYTAAPGYVGKDALVYTLNDLGNTGSDPATGAAQSSDLTVNGSMDITITAVNDAPSFTNAALPQQTLAEDASLVFSTANGNALTVTDPDDADDGVTGNQILRVTLEVTSGTLTLGALGGLTVTGNGTGSVQLTGSIDNINRALEGLGYRPGADYNGNDQLRMTVNDDGATGTGGNLSASQNVDIRVDAVNDAPAGTVPLTTQNVDEEGTLQFRSATTNGLSISDVDDNGASNMTVTVSVGHGTLTASGAGLSGAGTNTLTITGTKAQINAVLATVDYTPTADYNGEDVLTLAVNDGGNTGSGGALADSRTVDINVKAFNDAPTSAAPTNVAVNEDEVYNFGNTITVGDPDSPDNEEIVDVTLSLTNNGRLNWDGTARSASGRTYVGSLELGAGFDPAKVTVLAGASSGADNMTLRGKISDINAALNGLKYQGDANFNGQERLTITVNDRGNYGEGGALSTTPMVVTIDVAAVNDKAVVATSTGDGVLTYEGATNAGNSYGLGTQGHVVLTDLDEDLNGSNTIVELTIAATGGSGASIYFQELAAGVAARDANGNAVGVNQRVSTITYVGTRANIQAQLDKTSNNRYNWFGVDYNAQDTFSITLNDKGNGDGGVTSLVSDLSTFKVFLQPFNSVNEAPLATAGGSSDPTANFSVKEDSSILLKGPTGLSLNDTLYFLNATNNSSSQPMQVTLTAQHGTFTYNGTLAGEGGAPPGWASIVLSPDGRTLTVTMQLRPLTTFMAAGITYTPDANYNGVDPIVYTVNDMGNKTNLNNAFSTDPNSANRQVTTININMDVEAVNDTPVITPGSTALTHTIDEDTPYTFGTGSDTFDFTDPIDTLYDTTVHADYTIVLKTEKNGLLHIDTAGSGVSIVGGTANDTGEIYIQGTLAQLKAAMESMTYTPGTHFTGTEKISVDFYDAGHSGSGGVKDAHVDITMTVDPTADAPINTAPATANVREEDSLVFSAANNNAITVTDHDASSTDTAHLTVTLTVTHGRLTLASTNGLTITGGANGTATITISGSQANINAALNGLRYVGDTDYNGVDNLVIQTTDGTSRSDSDTVAITVEAVNDAPTAAAPISVNAVENADYSFGVGAVSVDDVDDRTDATPTTADEILTVTLTVANGILRFGSTNGLTLSAGYSWDSNSIQFTGTRADINAALDTLVYRGNPDYNGTDSLGIIVNDGGNIGHGTALEGSQSVAINVSPVNSAPENTVPASDASNPIDVGEDTNLVFSTANNNLISVGDPDDDGAGTQVVEVTLAVTNGTLTLGRTTGLTVTGNGSGTVTFRGTLANVNAALNGLAYRGNADYNGTDTLTITTNDLGNTGSGSPMSDTDTVSLRVTPVNDAPVNQVPVLRQSVGEDLPLTFSSANGNSLVLTDVDEQYSGVGTGNEPMEVTVAVNNGTVRLSQLTGLTVLSGANGTATVTVRGTRAAINAALEGLVYQSDPDYNGADTLTVTTNDRVSPGVAGYGAGVIRWDTDTIGIDVTPVNDAPQVSAPATRAGKEDAPVAFTGVNQITLSDIDDTTAGDQAMELTLSVTNGTLTFGSTTNVTFLTGSNGGATMKIRGTIADLNAALLTMTYQGDANYAGTDTLHMVADDLGNTGSGGALTFTRDVTITLDPVNDAPTNTLPAAQRVNSDADLPFSTANGNALSIGDVDDTSANGDQPMSVTLSVTRGTLTFGNIDGLTVTAGANGAASITVTGTRGDINAALNTLVYRGNEFYTGNDTLTIATNDRNNTGDATGTLPAGSVRNADGSITTTNTLDLVVDPVNHAPVNTVPGAQTVAEEGTLDFGGNISVFDPDDQFVGGADDEPMQVTLSVLHGKLTLGSTAGITFVSGADGTDTMVLTGTRAALNAALNGLTYRPNTNFYGADDLTVLTSDLGNHGPGGVFTDEDHVAITVTPVNDAPTIASPATASVDEDSNLVLSGANQISVGDVDDIDADGANTANEIMEVTLSAAHGALTLSQLTGLTRGDGTTPLTAADNGQASITFRGTRADINAALAGLIYRGDADFNGSDTISLSTNDLGNVGGAALGANSTVAVTVRPVNDAPENTAPTAVTAVEDTAFNFTGANTLSVADADDIDANGDGTDTQEMRITLQVDHGTLNFGSATGLQFNYGTLNGSSNITISGTRAALNAALATLSYTGDRDYNGSDNLRITTNDRGNTGSGNILETVSNVAITVGAVNDAPTLAMPPVKYVQEASSITYSGGDAVVVSDPDDQYVGTANDEPMSVTVSVLNGTLTMNSGAPGAAGLVIASNGSASVTMTGTRAQINAALDGMVYAPLGDYTGVDTMTVTANDRNNHGDASGTLAAGSVRNADGSITTTRTVDINMTPVNDPPTNTVPGLQSVESETDTTIPGLSVADVDEAPYIGAGNEPMTVTLRVDHGTLTLGSTTGLSFVGGANGSAMVRIQGTSADINAALSGLTYRSDNLFVGDDTLTITTNDNGNYGTGTPLEDTDTVILRVAPVNHAPVNNMPSPQSATEGEDVTFSAANNNAITVSDVDDALEGADDDEPMELTIDVANGTLTLSRLTGLTRADGTALTAADNGQASITFRGTRANINAALDGLVYRSNPNFVGSDELHMLSNDLGNTGSGGPLTDEDTVALLVISPVNDAPVNAVPGAQTMLEGDTLTFDGGRLITVSDPDDSDPDANGDRNLGDIQLEVTVRVNRGSLSFPNAGTNVVFTANDPAYVVMRGTQADLNAALAGLVYTPGTGVNGLDTLTITTSDLGNFGIGGVLRDTDTVDINITGLNSTPVNRTPAAASVKEDLVLTFSAANNNRIWVTDPDRADTGGDPDRADGNTFDANGDPVTHADVELTTRLAVTNGTLTLPGALPAGVTLVAGADGSSTMTLRGNARDINAVLDGLKYQGAANYNGTDTFTIETTDAGGLAQTDTFAVRVIAQNDRPVVAVPAAQTILENGRIDFTAISVNDADKNDNGSTDDSIRQRVTLSVSRGLLNLGTLPPNLSLAAGSLNSGSITLVGSLADINAALATLSYVPSGDYNGTDRLNITSSDLGNRGEGGVLIGTNFVDINVTAVNDAPVNTQATDVYVAEDTAFNFAGISAISVFDADDIAADGSATANTPMSVTLSVARGTLAIGAANGATVTPSGDGRTLVLTGTRGAINAALATLSYQGDLNFNGDDVLTMTSSDLGNTGDASGTLPAGSVRAADGSITTTTTTDIHVTAVNDAPTITVPTTAPSVAENRTLAFTGLAVGDVDGDGNETLAVTLSVGEGILNLGTMTGLEVSSGANGTRSVTVRGTRDAINAALGTLTYTGGDGYNGAEQLVVTAKDLGNFGTGGAMQLSQTLDFTVTPTNTAPVNTVPSDQWVAEDTVLEFKAANGNQVSVGDIDDGDDAVTGNQPVRVTLRVNNGTLGVTPTGGATSNVVTDDAGTGAYVLEISGTLADVNATLATLTYQGRLNASGTDTLTIETNDLGNNGAAPGAELPANASLQADGSVTTTDTVSILVDAVDDIAAAQIRDNPTLLQAREDTPLVFSQANGNPILITDFDTDRVTAKLSADHGRFTFPAGFNFPAGVTAVRLGDGSWVFNGPASTITSMLDGVSYTADANYHGSDQMHIEVASGNYQPVTVDYAINVSPVNDAPVNTTPTATQEAAVYGQLTFGQSRGNALFVSDVDENGMTAGSEPMRVTLTVTRGTLTAGQSAGVDIAGDGTGVVTLTGTRDAINAALEGLVYRPAGEVEGPETLTMVSSDLGNYGQDPQGRPEGTPLTTTTQVTINVVLHDVAPTTSFSTEGVSTDEDTPLRFSADTAPRFTDLNGDQATVTMLPRRGTFAMAPGYTPPAGLTVTLGDSGSITFVGFTGDINLAMQALVYTPSADYNGTDTVRINCSDDSGSNTYDLNIAVNAVNDAPVNTVPAAQTVDEDTALRFGRAFGNGISVDDADDAANGVAGDMPVQVTLAVEHGTLRLDLLEGVTLVAGTANGQSRITITGTLAAINQALDSLSYQGVQDFYGQDRLTITVADLGSQGKDPAGRAAGTSLSRTDTVDINVRPVNDAPSVVVPGENSASTDESTLLPFSTLRNTAIQLSDDGSQPLTLTIKPPVNGTLSTGAPGAVGLAVLPDGRFVLTGSAQDINNFLQTLGYTPNAGFTGLELISMVVSDGELETPAFLKIKVNPVYHAPGNASTGDRVIDPDSNTVFKKLDADGLFSITNTDDIPLDLVLESHNGTMSLGNLPGNLQITGNDTNNIHLHGTWEDINRALQDIVYNPYKGFYGTDPVEVILTKQGNAYPRIVFITVPVPARMGDGTPVAADDKSFPAVSLDGPVLTDDAGTAGGRDAGFWSDTRPGAVPDGEYATDFGTLEGILDPKGAFYEGRRINLALGRVRDGEYANSAFTTYNGMRIGGVTDGERLMEAFGPTFKAFDSRPASFYGVKNPLFQFDWENLLGMLYGQPAEGQADTARMQGEGEEAPERG